MSVTWYSDEPPPDHDVPGWAWPLVLVRIVLLVALIAPCFLLLLTVRSIEKPLSGLRRPVSPWITYFVCRGALLIIGLKLVLRGQPMEGRGAIVANHSSWLDIFVLNATDCVYFVSKVEVASWAGIGALAKATGTVFITRDRKDAKSQADLFETRLLAGHRLLFFPEGTSTDGLRVLPFKSTLFAAFFAPSLRDEIRVQPVSVTYHAPSGQDPRFYGWWGDTGFGEHLLAVLASTRLGRIEVAYHAPLRVSEYADRKALAQAGEAAVRDDHGHANTLATAAS